MLEHQPLITQSKTANRYKTLVLDIRQSLVNTLKRSIDQQLYRNSMSSKRQHCHNKKFNAVNHKYKTLTQPPSTPTRQNSHRSTMQSINKYLKRQHKHQQSPVVNRVNMSFKQHHWSIINTHKSPVDNRVKMSIKKQLAHKIWS